MEGDPDEQQAHRDPMDFQQVLLPSDEEDADATGTPTPSLTIGHVLDTLPKVKSGRLVLGKCYYLKINLYSRHAQYQLSSGPAIQETAS